MCKSVNPLLASYQVQLFGYQVIHRLRRKSEGCLECAMSQHPPKDDERTTTVQITTPPDAAPHDQLLSRSLPTHPAEIDRNVAQQRLDDRQGMSVRREAMTTMIRSESDIEKGLVFGAKVSVVAPKFTIDLWPPR
ncbi:unnamed protein product [Nippostrongylus brasiliensis]|uniref:Uncharacterized protein n=1 Tax=Nippostrongylus brasiliensis TaxID=27835 RepID=A0A0N4YQ97_NIPBR|nr:unnamed protein product [Nippostrongylus brasiliensis]